MPIRLIMPRRNKPAHRRDRHYIRVWRDATGKTQTEVAKEIGLGQPTLSKIEAMKLPYSQDPLEKMARYFAGLLGPSYICTPAAIISRPPAPLPEATGITNEEIALVRSEINRLDVFREPVRHYYLQALQQVPQQSEALPLPLAAPPAIQGDGVRLAGRRAPRKP